MLFYLFYLFYYLYIKFNMRLKDTKYNIIEFEKENKEYIFNN